MLDEFAQDLEICLEDLFRARALLEHAAAGFDARRGYQGEYREQAEHR
jgi:hypothetical protein